MGTSVERALGFEHGLARRIARSIIDVRGGFAVRDNRYPLSHDHNRLIINAPVEPEQILTAADLTLGDMDVRTISLDVPGLDLVEGLVTAGYEARTYVLMVLAGKPTRQPPATVERVTFPEVRTAIAAAWKRSLPNADAATRRQLIDRHQTWEATGAVTHHVVRASGRVVSSCEMLWADGVGQIDSVMTEPQYEGRGFATAVVLDAIAAAHAAGCDLVYLRADADDWPRLLYRRLGFRYAAMVAVCTAG